MTKRIIDDTLFRSPVFGRLKCKEKLLYLGIICHADDQGRMLADPSYLRSLIFPFDDVAVDEMGEYLASLIDAQYIAVYVSKEAPLVQVLGWWEMQTGMQYAQPSLYPAPDGWDDRLRFLYTKGDIRTYNWRRKNGTLIPDTCNFKGLPLPFGPPPDDDDDESAPEHVGRRKQAAKTMRTDWTEDPDNRPPEKVFTDEQERRRVQRAHIKAIEKMGIDPFKFRGGRIPEGEGETALEIYYEFVSIQEKKLSAYKRGLVEKITDLDKWRSVLEEWHARPYQPDNLAGQLEWYHGTIPARSQNEERRSGGNTDTDRHRDGAGSIALGKRSVLNPDQARSLFGGT